MKKLLFILISVGILSACGDSVRSLKVKELANATIAEQQKYQDELQKSLSSSKAVSFGFAVAECSSLMKEHREYTARTLRREVEPEPEYCNQTVGELLERYKNK